MLRPSLCLEEFLETGSWSESYQEVWTSLGGREAGAGDSRECKRDCVSGRSTETDTVRDRYGRLSARFAHAAFTMGIGREPYSLEWTGAWEGARYRWKGRGVAIAGGCEFFVAKSYLVPAGSVGILFQVAVTVDPRGDHSG